MARDVLLLSLLLSGCATSHVVPAGAYRFNGLDAQGEIRVFPVLRAHDPLEVRLDDYVTEWVGQRRARIRADRTRELGELPDQIALALPGAIKARLDPTFRADFRVARAPLRARDRLTAALRRDDPDLLESALRDVARSVGGDATLFSWVRSLHGEPVTTLDLPGTIIETPHGSIVVDLFEDPYLVEAEIGVALVTSDGHVVVRYVDTARTLLGPAARPHRAGLDLASSFAADVCKAWPDDPYLSRTDLAAASPDLDPESSSPSRAAEVSFERTGLGVIARTLDP